MAKTKSKTISDQRVIIGVLSIALIVLIIAIIALSAGRKTLVNGLENAQESNNALTISNNELQALYERAKLEALDAEKYKKQIEEEQKIIAELDNQIKLLDKRIDELTVSGNEAEGENEAEASSAKQLTATSSSSSSKSSSSSSVKSSSMQSSSKNSSSSALSSSATKTTSSSVKKEDDAAAKAAQEAAKKAAEQAAAEQAAAEQAAAANAAKGHAFTDKFGEKTTFTTDEWNYLIGLWSYTGNPEEMISHRSIGELRAVLANR